LITTWPCGNTWETAFNLADRVATSYQPATGQSGTGRNQTVNTYDALNPGLAPGAPGTGQPCSTCAIHRNN